MNKIAIQQRAPLLSLFVFILCAFCSFTVLSGEKNQSSLFLSITACQILCFIVPGILYCKFYINTPKETLNFNIPTLKSVIFTVCLFIVTLCTSVLLSVIFPQNYTEVTTVNVDNVFLILVADAILPAICEEFIFRGIILSEYKKISYLSAAFFSSFLFALSHFSINGIFIYFFAGLMCSVCVYVTRSIFSSILLHFLYNASIIFLSPQIHQLISGKEYKTLIVILAATFLLLFLYLALSQMGRIIYSYATLSEAENEKIHPRFSQRLLETVFLILSPAFLGCILFYIIVLLQNF